MNLDLLGQLEKRFNNNFNVDNKICDIIVGILPFFKIYITYLNNYENANKIYNKYKQ